ncbi:MAG TPA: NAD(P)-dependent oxidoreductase, partial [Phototrophicaceae bacterium]|nr:NAD(P)-dependent oxidoreductase [Phototrophicaceae bacterium]
DEVLTRPQPALIEFVKTLTSPLVILGASGKMGPTLAVLARRAAEAAGHKLDVIAVSRFSDARSRDWLEVRGVRTLACDLFERESLKTLPDSDNVIYMVGLKFGTSSNPALTWAANTLLPANAAERYPQARIAALSTGNVYPLASVASGGWTESAALTPLGEYANSAIARERIFEYQSARHGTPITILRLSYALDLRYGVLVDIAQKVFAGQPVDLTSGYLNCIWQGDANAMVIRALALASSPPTTLNLTGSEVVSVREVAVRFSELMGRSVQFTGHEAETALLSKTTLLRERLGSPTVPLDMVIHWTAQWIMHGGALLNKPTHFEVRDGAY